MDGSFSSEQLREIASSSLFLVSDLYRRRSNGDLQYNGTRPGPDWHSHGYFHKNLWVMQNGEPVRKVLWKQRWLLPEAGKTQHSRPPDDHYALSVCLLVLFLKLFAWVDSDRGWRSSEELVPGLETVGTQRTVSRWLHRLLPDALSIQQAIRLAIIERSEPRPVEKLFPGGLSPPVGLDHRQWRDPNCIPILWRALALLFSGAIALNIPAALLLAEARGRMTDPESSKK